MGKGYRQGRLGEEIRRIISDLLLKEIKDPRLSGIVSISAVEASEDGSLPPFTSPSWAARRPKRRAKKRKKKSWRLLTAPKA